MDAFFFHSLYFSRLLEDIGTSSSQWDDGNNFSDEPDECRGIIVSNNTITTNVREAL